MTALLRGGRRVGNRPSPPTGEAPYRDALAETVNGRIEVITPFGRVDVATSTDVFEVEPFSRWTEGVRQALAYAASTGLRANVALFGPLDRARQLKIYLRLRDRGGATPIRLWFYCSARGWQLITNRQDALLGRKT